MSLLTDSGGTKDDLKLPTDDGLTAQVIFLSFHTRTQMTWLCIHLSNCDIENSCCVLLMQMRLGFDEGKDIVVSVMSSMGEEQICAVKEVGGGK